MQNLIQEIKKLCVFVACKSALFITNHSRLNKMLSLRQTLHFRIQHKLFKLNKSDVEDPLFLCELVPGDRVSLNSSGNFSARLTPFGLNIRGQVFRNGLPVEPKTVDFFLDGQPIRQERLEFEQGSAKFSFTIKRPTLTKFPVHSELMIQSSNGDVLLAKETDRLFLKIPFGTGQIHYLLEERGLLDKKGYVNPSSEEVLERQNEYLELYDKARKVFDKVLGRPLFLMYGTLLGVYRDGDFIPGDDDFDVGYISEKSDPIAVKNEAKHIIVELIREGFTVVINQRGKPFRLRDCVTNVDIHLDVRPVWYQDGCVWAHKHARLPLKLSDFVSVTTSLLRDVPVYIPKNVEGFLRTYYGEEWRVPDPGFSCNITSSARIAQVFNDCCLTPRELIKIKKAVSREQKARLGMGELIAIGLHDLYPLCEFERKCGF